MTNRLSKNGIFGCIKKKIVKEHYLDQESTNIFCKMSEINTFSFMSPSVLVTTTQLCYCSVETAIDNMQMSGHDWVPIKPVRTGGGLRV